MPQTVTVPAIRPFEYDGRYVAAGESITTTPIEAAALAYRGMVSLSPGYQHRAMFQADPAPQPEPVVEAPKRRRRRRSESAPEPEKPRRGYRRRDMTAEG